MYISKYSLVEVGDDLESDLVGEFYFHPHFSLTMLHFGR